jgi:hypothetical protein
MTSPDRLHSLAAFGRSGTLVETLVFADADFSLSRYDCAVVS